MDKTRRRLDRWSYWTVILLLAALGLLMLALPSLIVVATSLTSGYSLRFPPPGLSLRWYRSLLFDSPDITAAFVTSLKLAAAATAIATVLGVAAAIGLGRRGAPWARLLEALFLSPLTIPSLALGLGILVLFNLFSAGLSFASLLTGHVALCAPYIVFTTSASYAQLDPTWLDASRSLGASPFFTFRRVVLPNILPGILSGAFIAFMNSFDNVALSLFLSDGRSEVLPIRLWHIIEDSLDVRAAAASGVLIAITVLSMLLMERVAGTSRFLR
ncbi:ABC transporter permease [Telmatospirillum siberiense]|uniref:ABC transporter permease n=1 Tax=Telmatospirillum siberiense TaxID=382514 RepID=A0A2N3PUW5_9PROT|nr:ABC transporter permease [Telmatospirillum siberiense]PKU24199.1 ABC transporter permease [Telmatospirillum siberiense]